jgi:hypothetical protein
LPASLGKNSSLKEKQKRKERKRYMKKITTTEKP